MDIEFIKNVALGAGKILQSGFTKTKNISLKEGNHNLVTQFDVESEQFILSQIYSEYPSHSILAEESGSSELNSDYLWIVDPLDGTVNFAHGIPIFSVSIACCFKGNVIAGAIYQPITNELFYAENGKGAFLNGEKILVSTTRKLSDSLLVTGFPYDVHLYSQHSTTTFNKLIDLGVPIRRLGSAALDMAYVAAGRFEGFWEVGLKPWDIAAGILIVQEAGGRCTTYEGNSDVLFASSLVCSNSLIHSELSDIVIEGLQ